jgi:hypothetical protein
MHSKSGFFTTRVVLDNGNALPRNHIIAFLANSASVLIIDYLTILHAIIGVTSIQHDPFIPPIVLPDEALVASLTRIHPSVVVSVTVAVLDGDTAVVGILTIPCVPGFTGHTTDSIVVGEVRFGRVVFEDIDLTVFNHRFELGCTHLELVANGRCPSGVVMPINFLGEYSEEFSIFTRVMCHCVGDVEGRHVLFHSTVALVLLI